jgi:signal transduction histidine kinase
VDDGDLRREIEELRATRSRLIATADAERRRVERDLHDGVQQHLVALAVNLQVARRLADEDPGALMQLLEEIRRDVQEALDGVRRLAERVYPASLVDRGLVDALRAAASEAVIPTRLEAHLGARYPAAIEAAAYFCCVEALEAAASRAQTGERAIVRLRQEQHVLVFDLIVEGCPEPWTDQDLLAIGDRLGSVGGILAVAPVSARAACLSGTIPIAQSTSAR